MSPLPPRLSHRSHRTLIVGAGASFVIIAGLLALVTRPAPESRQPASRPALTVTLEPPQRLRWEHSIEAHGALEPWQEQVIGARSSGLPLAEVMVEVGDTVRERMHKLATSGAVSRQDVQQAETEADTTEAQVALARAQLSAKRLLLAYAEVRAADDGVVSARSATPGAGVICMYCVLVLLFGDFLQPFTILSALPLSLCGAFVMLLATGSELDVPSMIGLVMLMGIVAKNSILLVEYAVLGMREHGLSTEQAVLAACRQRARPILMTSLAMIAGMLPIALGLGADASFRQPMAIAVIGGLLSSTLLSLLVVPAVFVTVAGLRRRPRDVLTNPLFNQ